MSGQDREHECEGEECERFVHCIGISIFIHTHITAKVSSSALFIITCTAVHLLPIFLMEKHLKG